LTSEAPQRIDVPGLAYRIAPHRCFACGTLNADGMGLTIHVEPRRAWTDLSVEPRFQGWDGIAHGGILATVLDEVMAWSLVADDHWGLTARMEIQFRRPVEIGRPLHAEGWVRRSRRRLVDTEARIVDVESGLVLATSTGVYAAVDDARKGELQARYGWEPSITGGTLDTGDGSARGVGTGDPG
jgi:acyl-coenzyme A thioesterase PaaI-like protein